MRRGFTLIELVVVLTVLACAAGLIVPRMAGSLSRHELREAGDRLAVTARMLRETAIARGQALNLELDLDRNAYLVTRGGSQGSGEAVHTSWLKGAQLPEHVRVAEVRLPGGARASGGTQRISFNADGSCSGGAIQLTSGDREWLVVIHANGRARSGEPKSIEASSDQYDLGD